jgi:hypothetical protein
MEVKSFIGLAPGAIVIKLLIFVNDNTTTKG